MTVAEGIGFRSDLVGVNGLVCALSAAFFDVFSRALARDARASVAVLALALMLFGSHEVASTGDHRSSRFARSCGRQ